MNESELIFYALGAIFVAAVVIGIAKDNSGGRYSRPLPDRPEPLNGRQPAEVQGNFDSASLQTARAMISEVERYPDPTSRTLALAEMLHRTEQARVRQMDRAYQQERKEADALDRVLGIVDRLRGNQTPPPQPRHYYQDYPEYSGPVFPDPRARRINDWHNSRQTAETEYWNGGYYK